MAQQLNTRIVLRNDSVANWVTNASQVLLKGEVGVAFTDSGEAKIKIGDGVKTWEQLSYFGDGSIPVFNTFADAEAAEKSVGSLVVVVEGEKSTLYITQPDNSLSAAVDTDLQDRVGKLETIVFGATDDGVINTVKELFEYAETHKDESVRFAADITTLKELVGDTAVSEQINTALAASVQSISINGTVIDPVDGKVNIGVADNTTLGVVTGSDAENKIAIAEDGTMEVNTINASKIVQSENEVLVLNGGTSTVS